MKREWGSGVRAWYFHVLSNGPRRFVYRGWNLHFLPGALGFVAVWDVSWFVSGPTFRTRPCSARDAGKQSAKLVVNFHSQYMVWDITAHEGQRLCVVSAVLIIFKSLKFRLIHFIRA